MLKKITKAQIQFIRTLYKKKDREKNGLCICEGFRACKQLYDLNRDLIQYGVVRKDVDYSSFVGIEFFIAEDKYFERISSTVKSQGILFIVKIPNLVFKNNLDAPFVLVLDGLADPGNLGTIIRTAVSVGMKDLYYSSNSVDPFSEKTIRAGLSAQFFINLHKYNNICNLLSELKNLGYINIFSTEPRRGTSIFKMSNLYDKSVIVFGNEANGVGDIKGAVPINIPMPGKFESLNVSQAATIVLFEAVRRGVLR